jgi:hypothetical protein
MTKLDDLKTHIHEFDTKTRAPIKANRGGDTWVKVQQIADKIAVVMNPHIHTLEGMRAGFHPDKHEAYNAALTKLRQSLMAVDLAPVSKYISEHREGGSKARGMLSTAAAKAEEKKRVALAGDVIKRVGLMQMEMNHMSWNDY